MFIKKKIKKRSIDNKHQFNCVYEYVRNTADEVDKKTAIMFCDYVIDILCKNIESNMQLNFINHNVDDFVLPFHENEYENENPYSSFIWFPVSVTVKGKPINIETDSMIDIDLAKEKDEGLSATGWSHTFGSEIIPHLCVKTAFVDGEVTPPKLDNPHIYDGLSVRFVGAKVNPLLWFKAYRTDINKDLLDSISAIQVKK